MPYQQIIDNCFDDAIGQNGIRRTEFERLLQNSAPFLDILKQQKKDNSLPLLNLPERQDDLAAMHAVAATIRNRFERLVVLGTGGSTLNPQALVGIKPASANVVFVDHIDPDAMNLLLQQLDMQKTAFLAISKSGTTPETLAQTFVCVDALQKAGVTEPGKHLFVISDPKESPLRSLGVKLGATLSDHEPGVGGRFSALTNVGLIPALVAGFDVNAFRDGAHSVLKRDLDLVTSESAKGAALAVAMMNKGIHCTVLMPYIQHLRAFTIWYQQVWAESLGKDGKGSTPICAMGTLDQHSQLQLYLGGPHDKLITLITLDCKGQGPTINTGPVEDASLHYLSGKTIGDINAASQQATADTLARNGCPTRVIQLQTLNEKTLGALFMHFMLETIITAGLLGVNAFDQPAVEEGKVLARKLLA